MITIEDFRTSDLSVAQIVGAERVPQTSRLLKLKVDLGAEERTLVAGLGAHYDPPDLLGLKVIVVANLQPTNHPRD
jgi:methionine--tRNA ligase beta chain